MKSGIELIAEERKRQIEKEGYTQDNDIFSNDVSNLPLAAAAYIDATVYGLDVNAQWPWRKELFKPSGAIRNLEKAGALIAAAIDRIQAEEQENRDRYMEKQNQLRALTTLPEAGKREEQK